MPTGARPMTSGAAGDALAPDHRPPKGKTMSRTTHHTDRRTDVAPRRIPRPTPRRTGTRVGVIRHELAAWGIR